MLHDITNSEGKFIARRLLSIFSNVKFEFEKGLESLLGKSQRNIFFDFLGVAKIRNLDLNRMWYRAICTKHLNKSTKVYRRDWKIHSAPMNCIRTTIRSICISCIRHVLTACVNYKLSIICSCLQPYCGRCDRSLVIGENYVFSCHNNHDFVSNFIFALNSTQINFVINKVVKSGKQQAKTI